MNSVNRPVSPLQEGMLFHAMAMPGRGVDMEQITVYFEEDIDPDRFRTAWTAVFAAVPVLRSGFHWSPDGEPIRRMTDTPDLPFQVWDWRDQPPEAQTVRLAEYADQDRLRDFDLDQPPLHRFVLIRLAEKQWVLLWTFHHLLLDGRSFPTVLQSVLAHYDQGKEPTTPPRFDAFVDALIEKNHANSAAAKTFFETSMAGVEPAADLRIDSEDTNIAPPFGAIERPLTVEHTTELNALAAAVGVSLNNLVQAAWSILLHRYTAREHIVFGSTRACRHLTAEAGETVGLLINTLPLHVTVSRTDSVSDLCHQIAGHQRDLRLFESTPLQQIQAWCGTQSDRQLFNTLVMFDSQTLDARMHDPLSPHRRFDYRGQTNFPIALIAYGGESLLLRVEYARSNLGDAAAERMAAELVTIITGFCSGLEQRVGEVPYLSNSDLELLASWNDTNAAYSSDETLVSLFKAQVARTPASIALRFENTSLTYAELDEQSDRVAGELHRRGVRSGDIVALLARRSLEMFIGVYGILKSGAAYLPLDPDYPASRIEFAVRDAGAQIMVCAGGTRSHASDALASVIDLDSADLEDGTSVPSETPIPCNAAYVIYTSGSTGQPKGVINEHGGIVNRLLWMQEAFSLDGDDVVLHKTPITFDVSVWELFWALQTGAQVAIAPPEAHRDARWLASEIKRFGVTTLHFVPSMLQLFIEEPDAAGCGSIQRIICSGEALSRDLQDRTLGRINAELHNLYGPTEAAIDVTWWRCDPSSRFSFVPIGKPVSNTTIDVLDAYGQPVPPGVTGEIYIGGIQVARGYVNRPELTAERFLDDQSRQDGRLYRTGDLGRHLPNGALAFSGRTDHQIKLRGFRIELGEIESVLQMHTSVRNAAVLDHELPSGEIVLVAYYDAPAAADSNALREYLAARLADYMVPTRFIHIEALPLTQSGKVDRRQLPKPDFSPRGPIESARSETERTVSEQWTELLREERIDRNQPFFDAGGTSLLAVKLAMRLAERFGQEIQVADLLANPTVALQAQLLEGSADNGSLSEAAEQARVRRRAASHRRKVVNERKEQRQ